MSNQNNESNVPPANGATAGEAGATPAPLAPGSIVYVKSIDSSQVQGLQGVPPGTIVYAIHSEAGVPLAVLGNRDAAFYAARQHQMLPVSVH
ncbi:MAG TPA: DUF1150 family protein [Alphaproteobacteria bacterium]|nr:hypothetical protein [Alphaproteobacteria bacterium]HEX4890544.1 DUF1150 family protein [Alphaproteobacteria bacterium]